MLACASTRGPIALAGREGTVNCLASRPPVVKAGATYGGATAAGVAAAHNFWPAFRRGLGVSGKGPSWCTRGEAGHHAKAVTVRTTLHTPAPADRPLLLFQWGSSRLRRSACSPSRPSTACTNVDGRRPALCARLLLVWGLPASCRLPGGDPIRSLSLAGRGPQAEAPRRRRPKAGRREPRDHARRCGGESAQGEPAEGAWRRWRGEAQREPDGQARPHGEGGPRLQGRLPVVTPVRPVAAGRADCAGQ